MTNVSQDYECKKASRECGTKLLTSENSGRNKGAHELVTITDQCAQRFPAQRVCLSSFADCELGLFALNPQSKTLFERRGQKIFYHSCGRRSFDFCLHTKHSFNSRPTNKNEHLFFAHNN
jgi:hypothetical protein